jgi:hypothetical protein
MGPCLRDIQEAAEYLRGTIRPSPLVHSGYFSRKFTERFSYSRHQNDIWLRKRDVVLKVISRIWR